MARKGDQMPEDPEDFKGPAVQGVGEIQRLAAAANVENEKKRKAAERKSNVPDEVVLRNWGAIDSAQKAVDKIKIELDQAMGALRQKYATAKNDGCNIDAMKRVRKMERQDVDELDLEMRDVARIAGITGSHLTQLSFFADRDEAPKPNAYVQGFTAGKAGDKPESNPHQPGSDDHVGWEGGRKQGQLKLKQDLTRAEDKKDEKAGAKPKGGTRLRGGKPH